MEGFHVDTWYQTFYVFFYVGTTEIRYNFCEAFFFQRWVEWATTSTPRENEKNVPSKVHRRLKSEKMCISDQPNSGYMYKAQLRYKDRVNNKILSFVLYPYFLTYPSLPLTSKYFKVKPYSIVLSNYNFLQILASDFTIFLQNYFLFSPLLCK